MFGVYGFTLPKSGIICYSKIIDNGHIRNKRTTRARTLVIFEKSGSSKERGERLVVRKEKSMNPRRKEKKKTAFFST